MCQEYEDTDDPFEGSHNVHSGKIHVWGGISSRGTITLRLFRDNMDSEIYVDILKKRINEMNRLYPEGFIFMCHNDPKHKSSLAQNF